MAACSSRDACTRATTSTVRLPPHRICVVRPSFASLMHAR
jgi:hypothetical protein